jgi:hypothetical protein
MFFFRSVNGFSRLEGKMGYDVHITRKRSWDGFEDEHGPEISFEEWMAVVNADSEFHLEGHLDTRQPDGSVFRQPLAAWTSRSRHRENGAMVPFAWIRGNIVVKNPDEETCRKMWRVAEILNARVQGDDGEFYDSSGNPTGNPATI